jgi:hypothetical protein
MLKPGQIGTVIEDDGGITPFKVKCNGGTHWYTRSELVCADDHAARRDGTQSRPILSIEEFESAVSDESAALIAYFDDLRRVAPAYDRELQLATDRRDYGTAALISTEREILRQVIAADYCSWRKALIQDALADGIISRIRDEEDRFWRETTSAELERRSRAILDRPPRNRRFDFSLYDAALSVDLLRSKSLPTINAVLTALRKPTVASQEASALNGAGFSWQVILDWLELESSILQQKVAARAACGASLSITTLKNPSTQTQNIESSWQ